MAKNKKPKNSMSSTHRLTIIQLLIIVYYLVGC